MKVLITIPHVFAPKIDSPYSSQREEKRDLKRKALFNATIENINRHGKRSWIHASLGKGKEIITREIEANLGIDLTVKIYTHKVHTLADSLPIQKGLEIIYAEENDVAKIPMIASKNAIEEVDNYDLIGYMEDDILIEDKEFFAKIEKLVEITGGEYAFLPHRCEKIPSEGDVILSGDPDGGRPDLFWDTGETIQITWPLGKRSFYRATNPHSGCYFLMQEQAKKVRDYWHENKWNATFQLSGPLEQAGSGILLPVLKLMKPIPSDYRFLSVLHQDELWKRHPKEIKANSWIELKD